MKRTVLFIACVLASVTMQAQRSSYFDYLPFVEDGKKWNVTRLNTDLSNHIDCYMLVNEKVVKEGKTYMKMYRSEDDLTVVYDAGLLREENRKVYFFDTDMQKEYLMFDYSLKAGDTYETYSPEYHKITRYKVLSVGDYTEGPEIISTYYDEKGDSTTTKKRYLRKWIVTCIDYDFALAPKTWIEGVGSLENPFSNLYNAAPTLDHLVYVSFNNTEFYLPFLFREGIGKLLYGCNLPTGAIDYNSTEKHHKLTYELEGNRLHVYGKVYSQCGPNNYAYFYEELTDDPLVHKLHFTIQEVEPLADCMALHATDFYVSGFDSNLNYIVVDNQGEEHPVTNMTSQIAYRPFVEDGKVWAVKVGSDTLPIEEWIEYYYFDGDTIIDGRTAKRMVGDRISYGQYTTGEYIGAWYEQDKKVYFAFRGKQQFELIYDFTLSTDDSIFHDGYTWVLNKVSEGTLGFKGRYYDFSLGCWHDNVITARWFEGVGSRTYPWLYQNMSEGPVTLLACSVGDEVIYYNSDEGNPYFIGARKQRIDFTHTIKIKPKARKRSEAAQSLYGEYNDLLLGIRLDPLDDAYQVCITDEAGKAVYEKTVNAGSIVGLNIDIAAYAAGRYTVTVENSQEAFTGQFEAQATGIEEAKSKRPEQTGSIYNLQGQRVSTLQKGLNIVNGQKVYVR